MSHTDKISENVHWTVKAVQLSGQDNVEKPNVVINSDDFTHDATIKVFGDFGSLEQKQKYCEEIAYRLNAFEDKRLLTGNISTQEAIDKIIVLPNHSLISIDGYTKIFVHKGSLYTLDVESNVHELLQLTHFMWRIMRWDAELLPNPLLNSL